MSREQLHQPTSLLASVRMHTQPAIAFSSSVSKVCVGRKWTEPYHASWPPSAAAGAVPRGARARDAAAGARLCSLGGAGGDGLLAVAGGALPGGRQGVENAGVCNERSYGLMDYLMLLGGHFMWGRGLRERRVCGNWISQGGQGATVQWGGRGGWVRPITPGSCALERLHD